MSDALNAKTLSQKEMNIYRFTSREELAEENMAADIEVAAHEKWGDDVNRIKHGRY